MKFHIIPNACSLETIQSCIFKNLKKPSLLVTPPVHPSFFNHPMQDFNNNQSVTTVNEGVTASQLPLHPSHNSADLQDAPSSAGTSLQGKVRKMSRAMAESVSQRDFYRKEKMHYMASQAVCKHDYDRLHDSHLDLQDHMRHPITFLA